MEIDEDALGIFCMWLATLASVRQKLQHFQDVNPGGFATEEWGTSDLTTAMHGSLTGQGGGEAHSVSEAGGISARINMVYFGNQRSQEYSTEQSISIAYVRDKIEKQQMVERGRKIVVGEYDGESRKGEKDKQAKKGSFRSKTKVKRPLNVTSTNLGGGEAGPSVGNASVGGAFRGRNPVGGAHLHHFLGVHLDPAGQRRAQGIPDVGC